MRGGELYLQKLTTKIGIGFATAAIAAVSFAIPAFAQNAQHFGPYHSTTPDNGSCSQPWANDTFDRFFTVKNNKDGTFHVREEFRNGSFVTTGPASPGACETSSDHGTTVQAGVTGKFHGFLDGSVTGGMYNPNGCTATPAACTTTSGFIAATFGPTAQFCTGADCRFNFEYNAPGQGLVFHHWQDANTKNGTEFFKGDIANNGQINQDRDDERFDNEQSEND